MKTALGLARHQRPRRPGTGANTSRQSGSAWWCRWSASGWCRRRRPAGRSAMSCRSLDPRRRSAGLDAAARSQVARRPARTRAGCAACSSYAGIPGQRQGQRRGGVVALAHVEHPQALDPTEVPEQRGQVGQRLGRVLPRAHRVDHRHPPLVGVGPQFALGPGGARDQDVEHAGEHPAGVLHGLPGVQLQVARAVRDQPRAQPQRAGGEGGPGAGGGLAEQHADDRARPGAARRLRGTRGELGAAPDDARSSSSERSSMEIRWRRSAWGMVLPPGWSGRCGLSGRAVRRGARRCRGPAPRG